jgi:hypothetical protein
MAKLKTERHHWWPRGVSQFWTNDEGCVHWLWTNGEVRTSRPGNFGMIGNGHHVRLGKPDEPTVWDTSFEADFQRADDNFPTVIRWLEGLDRTKHSFQTKLRDRFKPVNGADAELAMLAEGIVSLAVVERHRGPLPERERNMLIAMNMRSTHRDAVKQIGIRGKFVAIYSPDKEFIFGDGFYHNIRSSMNSMFSPTILAPLTPQVAALFVRPVSYTSEPRFFTLMINADETETLNHAVQVYSRDKLFYRSERPDINDEYSQGKHLIYRGPTNPINDLIHHIPGVPPRDKSLDFLSGLR